MNDFECKECGRKFDSRKGFHIHLKQHVNTIGEYYVKHFPKQDLYTKDPLQFKNYDEYFRQDFNNFDNFVAWMNVETPEKIKPLLVKKAKKLFDHKGITSSPPSLFYQLSLLPDVHTYRRFWGSYNAFLNDIGVKNVFPSNLPDDFWGDVPENMCVFVDTREKTPFTYTNSQINKLDFGDYTVGGDYYTKTFVDRKSEDDFRQTFGASIDRFRREMDRCVQFGCYMFVVVESSVLKTEINNKKSKFKSNLSYVWHNVKNLMKDYPENFQLIFAHNRAGAQKITPKILYHGEKLKTVDLQYHIDAKIHGDTQRGQQIKL